MSHTVQGALIVAETSAQHVACILLFVAQCMVTSGASVMLAVRAKHSLPTKTQMSQAGPTAHPVSTLSYASDDEATEASEALTGEASEVSGQSSEASGQSSEADSGEVLEAATDEASDTSTGSHRIQRLPEMTPLQPAVSSDMPAGTVNVSADAPHAAAAQPDFVVNPILVPEEPPAPVMIPMPGDFPASSEVSYASPPDLVDDPASARAAFAALPFAAAAQPESAVPEAPELQSEPSLRFISPRDRPISSRTFQAPPSPP